MNGSAISRRLMLALFAVTIVPILGWSVVVDLAEHLTLDDRSHALADVAQLEAAVRAAKSRLVLVLGLSLATFAGALLYLRRVLVVPIESLADRARGASADWHTPPECGRKDEIGDLARALDAGVSGLARRAERARRFAADLSHELRTPLAAIQGAAELLARESLSSAETQRFSENILHESQRLGRLVDGILELERGAPDPRANDEVCELFASIRRVTDGIGLLAGRKDVRIELATADRDAWARVDADRHDRVLFALLENALKFSPAGTVVSIGLEASVLHYRVSVCDRGPGVPAAERETIFERYAYMPAPGSQRGTGLGLAIARALVESWNGTIAVDDGPSGGARFFYDVPRAAREGEAQGPLHPVSG